MAARPIKCDGHDRNGGRQFQHLLAGLEPTIISPICEILGIDFPLFVFSHCRDVVAEVSKAGDMGVLGVAGFSPQTLKEELSWIDQHVDGRPYGIDLIVPAKFATKDSNTRASDATALIPTPYRDFVSDLLARHDVDSAFLFDEGSSTAMDFATNMEDTRAREGLDVAFSHPIRLIANALGPPPEYMIERTGAAGIPVPRHSRATGSAKAWG